MKDVIISAACRATVNGELNIFPVHRHCDFFEWMKLLNCDYERGHVEQGFIAWNGKQERFVSRVEAAKIAYEAGQIDDEVVRLYSEDLY